MPYYIVWNVRMLGLWIDQALVESSHTLFNNMCAEYNFGRRAVLEWYSQCYDLIFFTVYLSCAIIEAKGFACINLRRSILSIIGKALP